MTCWIAMEPGAVVVEHSHTNEQLGVVVEGSVTITAAGETREMLVGDAYVVPSDVVHHGVAGANGVLLVETFVPIREEYAKAWRAVAAGRVTAIAAARRVAASRRGLPQSGIGPDPPDHGRLSTRARVYGARRDRVRPIHDQPDAPADVRRGGAPPLRRVLCRARPPRGAVVVARAPQRPDRAADHRRHAADDALLPRAGDAAGAPHGLGPEVLPHRRHRRGRRREPLHLLLHARQLLGRRLLQAGIARLVVGVPDRGAGPPGRAALPDCPSRRRGRLRDLARRDRRARGADRHSLDDNWWGPVGPTGPERPRLRDLLRPRPGARLRRARLRPGLRLRALPRGLEQRLHGVLPGARTAPARRCPRQHVDTGMGLERLAMVMQGAQSIYDTDLYQAIIQRAAAPGRASPTASTPRPTARCASSPTTPAAAPS